MTSIARKFLTLAFAIAGACGGAAAQEMTLETVLEEARTRSVASVSAKSDFISSYWSWRSYLASRLPSLSLYGNLGGFDRSLRLLQDYNTGELVYRVNFNMRNGNFELNMADGEIRFKTYVHVGSSKLDMNAARLAITLPFAMFNRFGDGLLDVLFGFKSPREAFEAIGT